MTTEAHTTPPCVLIVDDDDDVRLTLAEVIAEEGYRVREATNGRDALDRLGKEPPPDLILLDMMMPVMDGWQFRSEQQRDPRLASIPVVILTANPRSDLGHLAAAAQLRKPVALDDLLAAIAAICGTPGN